MRKELTPITKLLQFMNSWASEDKTKKCHLNGFLTNYGEGYHQACSDIFDKCAELGFTSIWEKEMGYPSSKKS